MWNIYPLPSNLLLPIKLYLDLSSCFSFNWHLEQWTQSSMSTNMVGKSPVVTIPDFLCLQGAILGPSSIAASLSSNLVFAGWLVCLLAFLDGWLDF